MYFYKNEINGEICGLTTAPYEINADNFYEVTEEEYLQLGGIIPQQKGSNSTPDIAEEILNAFIE